MEVGVAYTEEAEDVAWFYCCCCFCVGGEFELVLVVVVCLVFGIDIRYLIFDI